MNQQTLLDDAEIAKIVGKVLRKEFKGLGLEAVTTRSEEDFDGASVIRVDVRLKSGRAPVDRLMSALSEVRSQLIASGEDRFVFLSSARPEDEPTGEESG